MLPSMGPIMSSMPILEPAEAMETDVPLEEVFMMFLCVNYYVVLLLYV